MAKYNIESPIKKGKKILQSGQVELSDEAAAPLLALGAVSAVPDSKAEAEAKAEAEKKAKAEAEKKAKAEAEAKAKAQGK